MENVLQRLGTVESKLDEVLQLLKSTANRKAYHAKKYSERKAKKALPGLRNPNCNMLEMKPWGYDKRLQADGTFKKWALVACRFARDPSLGAHKFLQWLSYTWNSATYWHKVITRSGGYNHLFTGFSGSGNKPMRTKRCDNDLFGCMKRTKFTKAQRDQFEDALWWMWGFGVLCKVNHELCEMPDAHDVVRNSKFMRPLRLMMGQYGEVQLRQDLVFDQTESDPVKLGKMYGYAKPDLDMAWNACKRGLCDNVEPFTVPSG